MRREIPAEFIPKKDDSEMAFVANNVLAGMYLNNNPKIQEIYKNAYEQIAVSNNTEAIQNLVKDITTVLVLSSFFSFLTTFSFLIAAVLHSRLSVLKNQRILR